MASNVLKTTLTSAASTLPSMLREGILRLSGTFSATLQIEVDALGDGTWAPALDSTGAAMNLTVPGVMRINNGVPCNTRVTCTAYTSGTVNIALRD